MPATSLDGTILDHVAHAVPRWQDVWERYAVDLGAAWSSGGPGPGFAPAQLSLANGARVEVLMPHDTAVNDFLARFLAASGPGPHHLTFKVPDLAGALNEARTAGFSPVGVDLSHPEWMEGFLHPKEATGIVVQLAEAPESWNNDPPADFPTAHRQSRAGTGPLPPAMLDRAVHAVADLDEALRLFSDLLGGRATLRGEAYGLRWVELTWGGPLALRLVGPATPDRGAEPSGHLGGWLAGRPGRLHHLSLTVAEPEGLDGAVPAATAMAELLPGEDSADAWIVPPAANAGLRLVLHRAGRTA